MNLSLTERFAEIAAASRAEQQVKVIIDLAKSAKLPQSRGARRDSWSALLETARVHLDVLDRQFAGVPKRAKKRAPAAAASGATDTTDGNVPISVVAPASE